MESYGIVPRTSTSKADETEVFNHNNFYYYSACVKEFDVALGKIMSELENRGLKESTLILIYGDHNTYYSNLSNYVKNIENDDDDNHTNLYRVPCMIYHPEIENVINVINTNFSGEVGKRFIFGEFLNSKGEQVKNIQVKKFTCTADIVPTLLDLMGINYYENFYFGNSVFSENTSVLYSRAYNVFMTDSVYFSSLKKIKWQRENGNTNENKIALKYADISTYNKDEHIKEVEKEARNLLEKLDACNRVFYNDYFALKNINNTAKTNAEIYADNIKAIN